MCSPADSPSLSIRASPFGSLFIHIPLLIPLCSPFAHILLQIQIEKSLVHFSDLQRFMSLWQHYDPERKLLINTHELPRLLKELGPPLGLSENCGRVELFYILEEYQIPEHGGQVCTATLFP